MPVLRTLSLLSGISGFEIALKGLATPIAYCDIDADARTVIQERMKERLLPRAPVLEDVCDIHARDLPSAVDMIVGGYPCTDLSSLGARLGMRKGKRSGLVREVFRLADETKCPMIFMENVAVLVTHGFDLIVDELVTQRGYEFTWGIFSASQVGAPHVRRRIYMLFRKPGFEPGLPPRALAEAARGQPAFDWRASAAPPRMVPPERRHADCRRKRVAMCGNSIVPQCARFAFATLLAGFADERLEQVTVPRNASFPPWGVARRTPSGTRIFALRDPPPVPSPGLSIVLDPKAFDGKRRQEPMYGRERSPYLTEPLTIASFSTPRSVTTAAQQITERTSRDLPTQVRFARDTPANLRSGQLSAEFCEWLMGYPVGWTLMPAGHVAVPQHGARPGMVKAFQAKLAQERLLHPPKK